MEPEEAFRNYNLYRRLVRRQLVQPLAHTCGEEYVSGLGANDTFLLNCYACDVSREPGLAELENIRAVVKEHFSD